MQTSDRVKATDIYPSLRKMQTVTKLAALDPISLAIQALEYADERKVVEITTKGGGMSCIEFEFDWTVAKHFGHKVTFRVVRELWEWKGRD